MTWIEVMLPSLERSLVLPALDLDAVPGLQDRTDQCVYQERQHGANILMARYFRNHNHIGTMIADDCQI